MADPQNAPAELSFRLDSFEGPLDLLLRLIQKNKVDILDIPISMILEQFMVYVEEMRRLDLDSAGEFIDMASELMLIKSRMLLPRRENGKEEDPRADLAAALLEYKRMKDAAARMYERYRRYSARLPKGAEDIAPDETLYDQDPARLADVFHRIARRMRDTENAERETGRAIGSVIHSQPVSIPAKIVGVMRKLYRRIGGVPADEFFLEARSRSELVAVFMAILELLRVRRVLIAGEEEVRTESAEDAPEDRPVILILNRERSRGAENARTEDDK